MPDWSFLIIYLSLGAFAGIMAGLLGVGGGLIIVPALAWVFRLQGIDDSLIMHIAIGTSLATIVVTSIASVRAHHKRGAVLWPVFWQLTPGIVAGALAGAFVADLLPGAGLRLIFGVFVLVVALQMAFDVKPAAARDLPHAPGMAVAGGVIGSLSAIVGIGGGSLTVPFLTWCNTAIRNAVATSAACGLPIAVTGTLGFVATGWGAENLPAWSLGHVYLPALAGIILLSMVAAPFGAKLAHTLPTKAVRRLFALFLAAVGSSLVAG